MSYGNTNDTWCSPPYSEVTLVVTIIFYESLSVTYVKWAHGSLSYSSISTPKPAVVS